MASVADAGLAAAALPLPGRLTIIPVRTAATTSTARTFINTPSSPSGPGSDVTQRGRPKEGAIGLVTISHTIGAAESQSTDRRNLADQSRTGRSCLRSRRGRSLAVHSTRPFRNKSVRSPRLPGPEWPRRVIHRHHLQQADTDPDDAASLTRGSRRSADRQHAPPLGHPAAAPRERSTKSSEIGQRKVVRQRVGLETMRASFHRPGRPTPRRSAVRPRAQTTPSPPRSSAPIACISSSVRAKSNTARFCASRWGSEDFGTVE